MRRVLKAVANNTSIGDLTTLEDKSSVEEIIKAYQELKEGAGKEEVRYRQSTCHCESRFIGTKQSRGRAWVCHASLAMIKEAPDKSGNYRNTQN